MTSAKVHRQSESESAEDLIPVLVVGGEESLIKGNWKRKLASIGMWCSHHITNVRKVETIPTECKGILIVSDMCKHSLSDSAVALAKEQGLPFVAVQRKWSQAISHIESAFRDLMPKKEMQDPEVIIMPNAQEIQDFMVELIYQRVRGKKEPPSYDEIRGACAAHFGIPQPGKLGLSKNAIKQASQVAYERIAYEISQNPEESMRTQKKGTNQTTEDDIREVCVMLAQDNPEWVLSRPGSIAKTIREWFDTKDVRSMSNKRLTKIWDNAVQDLQKDWKRLAGSTGDREFRETVDGYRNQWIYRTFKAAHDRGEAFPQVRDIMDLSKRIFGRSVHGSVLKAARLMVINGEAFAGSDLAKGLPVREAGLTTEDSVTLSTQDVHDAEVVRMADTEVYHPMGEALSLYHAWCKQHKVKPGVNSKDHFANLLRDGRVPGGRKIDNPRNSHPPKVWGVRDSDIVSWAMEYHNIEEAPKKKPKKEAKTVLQDQPKTQKSTPTQSGFATSVPTTPDFLTAEELTEVDDKQMPYVMLSEGGKLANHAFNMAFYDFRQQIARATEQQMASLRTNLTDDLQGHLGSLTETLAAYNGILVELVESNAALIKKVDTLTAEVSALKEDIPNVPTIVTPEGVIQDPNLEYLVVRSNEATGDGSPTIKSMLDAGIVVRLESKADES